MIVNIILTIDEWFTEATSKVASEIQRLPTPDFAATLPEYGQWAAHSG